MLLSLPVGVTILPSLYEFCSQNLLKQVWELLPYILFDFLYGFVNFMISPKDLYQGNILTPELFNSFVQALN